MQHSVMQMWCKGASSGTFYAHVGSIVSGLNFWKSLTKIRCIIINMSIKQPPWRADPPITVPSIAYSAHPSIVVTAPTRDAAEERKRSCLTIESLPKFHHPTQIKTINECPSIVDDLGPRRLSSIETKVLRNHTHRRIAVPTAKYLHPRNQRIHTSSYVQRWI